MIRTGRRASAYNPDANVRFRADLRESWTVFRVKPKTPIEGRLAIELRFAGSSRSWSGRRANEPDVSNVLKAVEDAGNAFLWIDDRQIKAIRAELVAWGKAVKPWISLRIWRV